MLCSHPQLSVLFMLRIKFCTFKSGSESEPGGEVACSLFSETVLVSPHSVSQSLVSAVGTAGESAPFAFS